MNAPSRFDEMDADLPALKLPPHSIEAEQSILGGLMLDNSAWDRIADIVSEADFYRDEHRRIFRQIASLIERGKGVDIVTVFEGLQKNDEAQNFGGLAYLSEIANNTPSAANARRYAEIVRDKAVSRALILCGDEISGMGFATDGTSAEQRVAAASDRITQLSEGTIHTSGLESLQAVLGRSIERVQHAYSSDDEVTLFRTGLKDLDSFLVTKASGSVIVIGGRPGSGKTALALAILDNCSAREKEEGAVVMFSMEMENEDLADRLVSRVGNIPLEHMIKGKTLTDEDWQSMTFALGCLHERRVFLDQTPALRISQIDVRCSQAKRKHKRLKLIVIDYLQLMEGEGGENRTQEIGRISRGLKRLAKKHQCPVVVLSQLNRKLEERANKRPIVSDLRESGDIEQDADVILLCYRDEVYNPDSQDIGTAEIIIGKQRSGPSGKTARVAWIGTNTTFHDLDPHWRSRQPEKKPTQRLERGMPD
jgi:replicative DNA helicase